MIRIIIPLLSLFLLANAGHTSGLFPAASTGYVKKSFMQNGCLLWNNAPDSAGANMEYLLKSVDICNRGATNYGAGEFANNMWANINAVDWCAENLVIGDKHLKFTGVEYIDTGIDPSGVLKVEIDYMIDAVPVSAYPNPWGGRTTGYNGVELQYAGQGSPHFQVMSAAGNLTVTLGAFDADRHIALYDYGDCYMDGQFKGKVANYDGIISPYTIYIGALNENGRKNSITGFAGKVYSFRIWKSGVLLRDMIPHQNQETDEWGMWDRVSNSFFGNSGTGTLSGGD